MEQIAGAAGIPFVRLAVKQLKLSGWWALVASQAFAIVINVAVAYLIKGDLAAGVFMGVMVGLLSNFYNDVKTA